MFVSGADRAPSSLPGSNAMLENEEKLRTLMLAARGGDSKAAEYFLREVAPHLRRFIKNKLGQSGSASEAEDILQETLLAVHVKRHTYDPALPVTAWVYAIARYRVIDSWRAVSRSVVPLPLEDAASALAQSDHDAADSSRDLAALLARLPDRTRRLIEATKLDGYSIAEAAKALDVSETAAKVATHRGLKMLTSLFGGNRTN